MVCPILLAGESRPQPNCLGLKETSLEADPTARAAMLFLSSPTPAVQSSERPRDVYCLKTFRRARQWRPFSKVTVFGSLQGKSSSRSGPDDTGMVGRTDVGVACGCNVSDSLRSRRKGDMTPRPQMHVNVAASKARLHPPEVLWSDSDVQD